MRLFKAMIVLAGVLDLAMFLQSPTSPLKANSPVQTVGLSADAGDMPCWQPGKFPQNSRAFHRILYFPTERLKFVGMFRGMFHVEHSATCL